jgi:hypothetical protein
MTLYFFHLRDGSDLLLDPEGREVDSPDSIPGLALNDARSILGHDAARGRIALNQRIDVEDEHRNVVHSLDFVDAVEIVYP